MNIRMGKLAVVISFILYMGTICHTISIGEEPICSKFDFEEKVLEKMVKIDHKTGLITDSFHEFSTQVKNEIATMKADLRKQTLEQGSPISKAKTQIAAEVTKMKAEIEQLWLEHRDSFLEISNQMQDEAAIMKADIEKRRLEQNDSYALFEIHIQNDFTYRKEKIERPLFEQREILTNIQSDFELILKEFEETKVKLGEKINMVDETLRRSIDDLSNAFAELKLGPRQPSYAFSASDLSASRPSSGTILVFSKTNLDDHGVYNNQTGKFTASVSGIYTFSATINSMKNKAIHVEFVAGEESVGKLMALDKVYLSASGSATTRLEAGMEVYLRVISVLSGFTFRDDYYYMNSFSGHLIGSD